MQPSPFQIEAIGKTDRFTNNCFYLNGSWYWRGIFPVKYHKIPQKHVSLPTPTPFFHPMTPVWDRSPSDWGGPQSSKQHKFELRSPEQLNYIYIHMHTEQFAEHSPSRWPAQVHQEMLCFCIFSRGSFKQKQSHILQLLFDWTALKWRPQRNIQTAKHCLVWVSFVFAQNGKHWSCSTCLAMLHTAQFREGSYSFVVKH